MQWFERQVLLSDFLRSHRMCHNICSVCYRSSFWEERKLTLESAFVVCLITTSQSFQGTYMKQICTYMTAKKTFHKITAVIRMNPIQSGTIIIIFIMHHLCPIRFIRCVQLDLFRKWKYRKGKVAFCPICKIWSLYKRKYQLAQAHRNTETETSFYWKCTSHISQPCAF